MKEPKQITFNKWAKPLLAKGEWLNDNHNNYTFLDFADKFYPKTRLKSCMKHFNRLMEDLTLNGYCVKTSAPTPGLMSLMGRRKINTYIPTDKAKQLLITP